MNIRPVDLRTAFERKVVRTERCWSWNGFKNNRGGYGVIHYSHSQKMLAHRAAYVLFKGPIPIGKLVCHSCDNPSCVNPDHLWIGTDRDNTLDAFAKGRRVGYCRKKLRRETAATIRERLESGEKPLALAAEYGVHNSTIYNIRNGKMWKEPQ